ncbi:hypothetical protein D3C80_1160380 [compost metagenome]
MITGEPARRGPEACRQITKIFVGGFAAILRQIASSQQQVDSRLLFTHAFDHPLQAVAGIHAQQRALPVGEQMAVSQLHQVQGCIAMRDRLLRQGPTP